MDTMAERLFTLREKNKLSQTEVAHMIGVTSAIISAYEKAERKPSIERLAALADIYHTSTDYILGRTNKNKDALLIDVSFLSERQLKIIREIIEDMTDR